MTKEDYFEQAVNAFGDDKLDEAIKCIARRWSWIQNTRMPFTG